MGADRSASRTWRNLSAVRCVLARQRLQNVSVPIHLHTHNTTGTGDMTNLMAAQGRRISSTARSPACKRHFAAGDPSRSLRRSRAEPRHRPRQSSAEVAAHFRTVADKLDINAKVRWRSIRTPLLSSGAGRHALNLISQLKQANAEDKYYDVLAEVPPRARGLWPPAARHPRRARSSARRPS